MASLILHGTRDCTLCEQAFELVRPLAETFGWSLEEFDVVEDAMTFERFAHRVPVLQRSDRAETLDWPFTRDEVLEFLRTRS